MQLLAESDFQIKTGERDSGDVFYLSLEHLNRTKEQKCMFSDVWTELS